jgi:hypothetical protein
MNVSPTVSIAPSIDLHQEFTFAENTDTCGCCGFFKSRAVRPHDEVYVNSQGEVEKFDRKKSTFESRIRCNRHLAEIVKRRFNEDPIENDKAFEVLKKKINFDFQDDPITSEQLRAVVEAIYAVKKEYSDSPSSIADSDS